MPVRMERRLLVAKRRAPQARSRAQLSWRSDHHRRRGGGARCQGAVGCCWLQLLWWCSSSTGWSLLSTGRSLLSTGRSLLSTGRSLLSTGRSLLSTGRSLLSSWGGCCGGCRCRAGWVFDAALWFEAVGYAVVVAVRVRFAPKGLFVGYAVVVAVGRCFAPCCLVEVVDRVAVGVGAARILK